MLVYCDDACHCANPVGLIITDPNPVLPEDVYRAIYRASRIRGRRILPDSNDGQMRDVLEDGTVLPPRRRRQTRPGQPLPNPEHIYGTHESWSPRCRAKTPAGRRCGQRGGRWNADDIDKVVAQLEERGVTGVSLRALELIQTTGIRSLFH